MSSAALRRATVGLVLAVVWMGSACGPPDAGVADLPFQPEVGQILEISPADSMAQGEVFYTAVIRIGACWSAMRLESSGPISDGIVPVAQEELTSARLRISEEVFNPLPPSDQLREAIPGLRWVDLTSEQAWQIFGECEVG